VILIGRSISDNESIILPNKMKPSRFGDSLGGHRKPHNFVCRGFPLRW
jgi:hypothetical protein